MKWKKKKTIFFDLDGTLIDSVPDLALAVNEMLVQCGRKPFSEETIRYWVGNGAQTLVRRALLGERDIEGRQIDEACFEDALAHFLAAYRKHLCEATRPYPNVPETLNMLKERGYRLAIVTNKPEQFVSPILERLGMADLFEAWLGGDSLPKKKPDPMPLLHLCKTMDVAVDDAIVVGDSKNDILAAKACGMDSIGVTYGYNYGEDIRVYQPTAVIDEFGELSSIM